jgi:hypothetical protein
LASFSQSCDDVLKSVESYLARFQADLGAVSAEIETLQSRSVHLSSQLANRKTVERVLGPAVEAITVSPNTVRLISDGPISQEWIKALNEVESCSASIEGNSTLYSNVKAVEDVKPVLSDLKDKVRTIHSVFASLTAWLNSILKRLSNASATIW